VQIRTATGAVESLSTVQLDFLLPRRFGLEYIGEDGKAHPPVMIHRAIISTMERMIAFLIENYAGAFPVWLAPEQARILPIADRHNAHAGQVSVRLREAGLRAEVDASNERISYKIRNAQMMKVPYMLVVGDREARAPRWRCAGERAGTWGRWPSTPSSSACGRRWRRRHKRPLPHPPAN